MLIMVSAATNFSLWFLQMGESVKSQTGSGEVQRMTEHTGIIAQAQRSLQKFIMTSKSTKKRIPKPDSYWVGIKPIEASEGLLVGRTL